MAERTITGAVRLGRTVYTEGDEDALAAELTSDQVEYLEGKGVLEGDWSGVEGESADAEPSGDGDDGGEEDTFESLFGSQKAYEDAVEAGLGPEDFEGREATGATGFVVGDVRAVLEEREG